MGDTFPLLVPENVHLSSYCGIITCQGSEYKCRIRLPEPSTTFDEAILEGDEELIAVLSPHLKTIKSRLCESKDFESFFQELKDVLDRIVRPSTPSTLPPPNYYIQLIDDLEKIGWNRVLYVNELFSQVKIQLL